MRFHIRHDGLAVLTLAACDVSPDLLGGVALLHPDMASTPVGHSSFLADKSSSAGRVGALSAGRGAHPRVRATLPGVVRRGVIGALRRAFAGDLEGSVRTATDVLNVQRDGAARLQSWSRAWWFDFCPGLLLGTGVALLVYAYYKGVYSSRSIERACHEDVAFRVMTGAGEAWRHMGRRDAGGSGRWRCCGCRPG